MQQDFNGLDTGLYSNKAAHTDKYPEYADYTFRVRNRWVNADTSVSHVDGHYGDCRENRRERRLSTRMTGVPVTGCEREGIAAVESLLQALAGCLTAAIVFEASVRGVAISSISSQFEGDLDIRGFLGISDTVRSGFNEVRISIEMECDLDGAGKAELIRLAQERSPVFDSLVNGIPVKCFLSSLFEEGPMAAA